MNFVGFAQGYTDKSLPMVWTILTYYAELFFFTQHAVVKAREAFSSERWEAKEAELRKPKFVQTEAFPESA